MELENIVANTVYLKAREGKVIPREAAMSGQELRASIPPLPVI